jgi:hypothetical protein
MLPRPHAGSVSELLEEPRVRAWNNVAPPAALDELVRARLERALEERRAAHDETERAPEPLRMPHPERWVYAFGVVAYGAQLASGLVRVIWGAFAG